MPKVSASKAFIPAVLHVVNEAFENPPRRTSSSDGPEQLYGTANRGRPVGGDVIRSQIASSDGSEDMRPMQLKRSISYRMMMPEYTPYSMSELPRIAQR